MRLNALAVLAATALIAAPAVAGESGLAIYFENFAKSTAHVSMDTKPVCTLKPSQRCLWQGKPAPSEAYVIHIEVEGGKSWDGLGGLRGVWPVGHLELRVKPCDFVDGPTLHVKVTAERVSAACPDPGDFF